MTVCISKYQSLTIITKLKIDQGNKLVILLDHSSKRKPLFFPDKGFQTNQYITVSFSVH